MVLKKHLGKSTLWMSFAASSNSLVSFFIFVVLSRILAPEDIGLVAFTLIFVEVGKIVVNSCFAQAIIRHPVWDETFSSTCFYINMVFAILVTCAVFFIAAPLLAAYYNPQAGPILQVLSAIFFIEGIKAAHEGKLKRDFVFHVIAIRTIIAGLVSGAAGIYLALNDFGVWALVWQQVINHTIVSVLTLISVRWLPKLVFSISDAKQLIRFSTPLMISQLVSNLSQKVFELMIGVMIGPAALGFYRVGGRAVFILQEVVLKPFEHTVLSALARINDHTQQGQGTARVIRMSAYLTFPIFFGAAAIGPEFVILAFGEKWASSGHIMTILAVAVAPLVITYQVNAALTASGNSKLVMMQSGLNFILNCILAVMTVPFGLFIAAAGFALRSYLTIFLNLYFFKKIYGVPMLSVLKIITPSFVSAVLMFFVLMVAKHNIPSMVSPIADLVLICTAGIVIYGLLMLLVFRQETRHFFSEGMGLLPQKLRPIAAIMQRLMRLV